uniref:Uncharacterized protein n=1 Tax=Parascaris equorum TaxID=6256 RepID=A0A914RS99_PAREQ
MLNIDRAAASHCRMRVGALPHTTFIGALFKRTYSRILEY